MKPIDEIRFAFPPLADALKARLAPDGIVSSVVGLHDSIAARGILPTPALAMKLLVAGEKPG